MKGTLRAVAGGAAWTAPGSKDQAPVGNEDPQASNHMLLNSATKLNELKVDSLSEPPDRIAAPPVP